MKDIDGYVTKDSLYRLISDLRMTKCCTHKPKEFLAWKMLRLLGPDIYWIS